MFRRTARRVLARTRDGPVLDHAAQLSFYLVLGLAPFFLVLAGLASVLPVHGLLERALAQTAPLMPARAHALLSTLLQDMLSHHSTTLLTLGFVLALWSASRGVNGLRIVLNGAHGVVDPRPVWRVQGLALVFTLVTVLGVVLPLLGFIVLQQLASAVGLEWPRWWRSVSLPLLGVVLWGLVTVLYRRLPATRPSWRSAAAGSTVALLLFALTSAAFAWWVDTFGDYGTTHGSLASATVLLLWLYVGAVSLVVGGEVSAVGTQAPGAPTPAAEPPR